MKRLALVFLVGCGSARAVPTPGVYEIEIGRHAVSPEFNTVGDIIEVRAWYEGLDTNHVGALCTITEIDSGRSRYTEWDLNGLAPKTIEHEIPTWADDTWWVCEFVSDHAGSIFLDIKSGGELR